MLQVGELDAPSSFAHPHPLFPSILLTPIALSASIVLRGQLPRMTTVVVFSLQVWKPVKSTSLILKKL